MAADADWLKTTTEAALEPDLPIVDAHHHFWDHPDTSFSDGNRYFLAELLADVSDHNVRQTVFVECDAMYRADGPEEMRPVGEVEFVQGLAAQSASGMYGETRAAAAIVGTANLGLGHGVAPVLEALIAASPQRFRGIRHRAAWVEGGRPSATPPHLLLDAAFREGFAYLGRFALTFEAWVFHTQLSEVADLARAFPDTTIILNHLGGPLGTGAYAGRRSEVFAEWQPGMAEVAKQPNVVLKVGGIQMPMNGFGWHERERPPTSDELLALNRDWYLYAIEQFGPGRCLFESNFPVDRLSCSYTVLWNQFKKLTSSFRPDERAAMFHDNSVRVYRLSDT